MVLRKAKGVTPKASPVCPELWLLRVCIPAGEMAVARQHALLPPVQALHVQRAGRDIA